MKKLFTLLFISTILFSCSQDNEIADKNELGTLSFQEKLANGEFDTSNIGTYKGLFSTPNSEFRATVFLTLNGKSAPVVEFLFPEGDLKIVRSSQKTSKGQNINKMYFDEGNFTFDFTVGADGSNPVMDNVTYQGLKGDVIIVKETSKAPVQTKTGFYLCETGCFTDTEDTVHHPELGQTGAVQTFSFMLTNAAVGSSPITVQFVLNSRTYTGTVLQNNCANFDGPGDYTRCGMFAEPDLQGNSGPIRFRSLLSETTSQGDHIYRKDVDAYACSTYRGVGYYESTLFGRSTISFKTDQPLQDGGDCFAF